MLDMDSADGNAAASPPAYKPSEERAHAGYCTAPTSFMISDILDSSRRSPTARRRSSEGGSSEQEDDGTSVTDSSRGRDRHRAAPVAGSGDASDTESAAECELRADEDGCSKARDDSRSEDCCGGSPKSSGLGSPGE